MEHDFAVKNHAAERYLMGELNDAERDEYEEHFFWCAACADEIKAGSQFMETAREVVHGEKTSQIYRAAKYWSTWAWLTNWKIMLQPLPAAACVLAIALGGVVGYQNGVTISRMKSPTITMVTHDMQALTLGQRGEEKNPSAGKPLTLYFTIPPVADGATSFDSYRVEILNGSDVARYSSKISREQASYPVEVRLASGALAPGTYSLVVRGSKDGEPESGSKGEVARFPFELKE